MVKNKVDGITPTPKQTALTDMQIISQGITSRLDGDNSPVRAIIDRISRQNGYGGLSTTLTDVFRGHNTTGFGAPLPRNTDNYGLTFFTRPQLNMSYHNLIKDRSLATLLNDNDKSVARAIRAYLDPRGSNPNVTQNRLYTSKGKAGNAAQSAFYPSGLVDPLQAFIPLLDNNIMSLTGWPSQPVDTYTSNAGMYQEQWSMVDGFSKYYGVFDLSASFRNTVGDPINFLFWVWTQYAAMVHEGVLDPWPDMILNNRIDYNTRIYRLVLDVTRTYVQDIAACGAAFPTTADVGAKFNLNTDKPHNEDLDEVSIQFRCMGAIYRDPILSTEFNTTVIIFNPGMSNANRPTTHTKLTKVEHNVFKYKAYPRIDPYTSELEWWVPNAIYKQFKSEVIYPFGGNRSTPSSADSHGLAASLSNAKANAILTPVNKPKGST